MAAWMYRVMTPILRVVRPEAAIEVVKSFLVDVKKTRAKR